MRDYERGKDRKGADGGRLAKVSGALLVRRFSVREPEMFRVVEDILARKQTSMDKAALCELAQTAMDLELEGIGGDFIQAGENAGTAALLESAKRRGRTFLMCVPPYESTVPENGECALAFLDGADYGQILFLLERLVPQLVSGGHLVIDDYKTSEECKRGVDEFFRGKKGFQLVRKSRLHVIKS